MNRLILTVLAVVAITLAPYPASAEVPPDLIPTCIGQSGSVTATASLQTLAAALEVDLFLENTGTVAVRVDPTKAVLRTGDEEIAPWTADQVKRAHQDLGSYILAGAIFPPLLAITGASQLRFNRYVDGRALRAGELAAGGTLRGSIFFPLLPESQSRGMIELSGFTPTSGTLWPIRMYCALPRGTLAQAVVGGFAPLTVSLSARASTGPAEVTVESVEFASAYTALEVRIANKADIQAEIFGAMVNASMRDGAGSTYAGQPTRSEFGDLIPAKRTVFARLVFAPLPLPPKTAKAALTIPGIWFGPEDAVDVTVELRF